MLYFYFADDFTCKMLNFFIKYDALLQIKKMTINMYAVKVILTTTSIYNKKDLLIKIFFNKNPV